MTGALDWERTRELRGLRALSAGDAPEDSAAGADPVARQAIDALRPRLQPAEAEAIEARAHDAAGDRTDSTQHLLTVFAIYRRDPWVHREIFTRALKLASRLVTEDPPRTRSFFDALTAPFAVRALDMARLFTAPPSVCATGPSPCALPPSRPSNLMPCGSKTSWRSAPPVTSGSAARWRPGRGPI